MNVDRILAAWPLPGPWTLRSALGGANNQTWFVSGPTGTFILQISLNTIDPLRLAAEHDLLQHLARLTLSFAVPAPMTARSGATMVPVGDDAPCFAALFPIIPGSEMNPADLSDVSACGTALSELHTALAEIKPSAPLIRDQRYGPLSRVHPLLPDPCALIESLRIGRDTTSQLVALVRALDRAHALLLGTLPRQIIHADFDASNVLLHRGRVSGIVGFEFASVGLRAMDVAIGLWSFVLASARSVASG